MKTNSRRVAASIFARWLITKEFPAALLPTGPDRAFVQDLVYTAIRRLRPLRRILGEFVKKWPKGEMEALLYIGAAQLMYMPGVADYAAVNETVAAARESLNMNVPKLVNAVLRNLIRRREEMRLLIAAAPVEIRESFPTVLYRRWTARFGAADTERLCVWHNQPAETFLARKPGDRFEKLPRGVRVEDVEGFASGDFIVQDPGTRLAVALMDAQPGEEILDLCAAPGGKTVQLAWRGAAVTACEVNPKRRARLAENLARLKLADVAVIGEPPARTFRKVLVDAPCSNTGVLRRRPDARWGWSEEKMMSLVRLQAEILDVAAARVEPGGRLVYSTCSNEPEENQEQVAAFLARHPEFTRVDEKESIPFDSGCDGAFAAALRRVGGGLAAVGGSAE